MCMRTSRGDVSARVMCVTPRNGRRTVSWPRPRRCTGRGQEWRSTTRIAIRGNHAFCPSCEGTLTQLLALGGGRNRMVFLSRMKSKTSITLSEDLLVSVKRAARKGVDAVRDHRAAVAGTAQGIHRPPSAQKEIALLTGTPTNSTPKWLTCWPTRKSREARIEPSRVRDPGGRGAKPRRVFAVVSRQTVVDSRFGTVVCVPVFHEHGLGARYPWPSKRGWGTRALHCDALVPCKRIDSPISLAPCRPQSCVTSIEPSPPPSTSTSRICLELTKNLKEL